MDVPVLATRGMAAQSTFTEAQGKDNTQGAHIVKIWSNHPLVWNPMHMRSSETISGDGLRYH